MPDSRAMDWLERALSTLPRDGFKARLKRELERTIEMTALSEPISGVRQTATPQLRIRHAAAAIDFYRRAFDAREVMRFTVGDSVAHAEILIGPSLIMLGEEAPEHGFASPETLGGSPVAMHLLVDDADAAIARAVAAGARLVSPAQDQFYGDRSGRVVDPFGYTWTIAARTEDLTVDEMQRRFAALLPAPAEDAGERPEGFHTVTPYVVVQDAPALIEFLARSFDAKQVSRSMRTGGGVHAEVEIGDSMLMVGGGAPGLSWRGQPLPSAFHVYVPDTDATVARAIDAGATLVAPPEDKPYGERLAAVKDPQGSSWYIATQHGPRFVREGRHAVTAYLHPHRAEPVIAYLKRAFGAVELEKHASAEGIVFHAAVRVGDSTIEMGEAGGPVQPAPTMFYLYVQSVEAAYQRAIDAGGTSIAPPEDQAFAFGDRTAGVKDPFGNLWYVARRIAPRG
jgi:PhnB protein